MVSIPCNFFTSIPKLPLLFPSKPHSHSNLKLHLHQPPIAALNFNRSTSQPSNGGPQQLRTLFPGGFKRPEIKIPTVILKLSADEVLGRAQEDGGVNLDAAVAKGVGIVVVEGEGDGSGGRLYEAACVVKSVVGERAYLLVSERVDVAAAVGANGVLLSDQGEILMNLLAL